MKRAIKALIVPAGIALSVTLLGIGAGATWDPTALETTVANHETRITALENATPSPSPTPQVITETISNAVSPTTTQPQAVTPTATATPVATPVAPPVQVYRQPVDPNPPSPRCYDVTGGVTTIVPCGGKQVSQSPN
jgi:hypothetical protein